MRIEKAYNLSIKELYNKIKEASIVNTASCIFYSSNLVLSCGICPFLDAIYRVDKFSCEKINEKKTKEELLIFLIKNFPNLILEENKE